jgi:hypothetical protein
MSINENSQDQFSIKQAGTQMDIQGILVDRVLTIEQLIEKCNIDLDVWEINKAEVTKWDVTGGFKLGTPITRENYRVHIKLTKRVPVYDGKRFKEDILKDIKEYKINYPTIVYTEQPTKRLLEIDVFDFHYGKLCWADETGENYDTKIAEERFINAITELLVYASPYKIEQILFPLGNDFFNSDTRHNTTSNLTPQDEDLRWQKTIKKGRQLAVKAIEMLQTIAPVHVVIVQGNHDWERTFALGESLECWYNGCSNVTIDNNAMSRKYFRYGESLIGFTHGDCEKSDALPYMMSEERKQDWADTKFREFHLGHIHRKRTIQYKSTEDYNGITIRYLRSLSGTDAWHAKNAYKGNVKSAEGFIWDFNNGNIASFTSSV